MSSCLSIIYICGLLTCSYLNKESSILTIKYVLTFFWSLNCLVFKLYISVWIILDFLAVLILEVFYGGIFQKINFNSWPFFRCFFWCVNYAGKAFLSQHILDMDNILFESFQYWHRKHQTKHCSFSNFPDLEMTQVWSVNYIC